MTSQNEQKERISSPFLNPMGLPQNYFLSWIDISSPFLNPMGLPQNYFLSWIEAGRGFYENTLKANELWFKTLWDLWLRSAGMEQKETAKVE
jgi:hypothetical protein